MNASSIKINKSTFHVFHNFQVVIEPKKYISPIKLLSMCELQLFNWYHTILLVCGQLIVFVNPIEIKKRTLVPSIVY